MELTYERIRQMVGYDAAVILEIGANNGADTLAFLSTFPQGKVYCFEPEPRAIAKWRTAVTDPRAKLFEIALSDENGTATFYRSGGEPPRPPASVPDYEDWDKSGSLCKPTGHLRYSPWCTFAKTMTVPTMRLDHWYEQQQPGIVDFMHIDVQGAERKVFAGGCYTLAHTRFLKTECHPSILYEGQPTEGELRKMLGDWDCLGRYGNDLLLQNRTLS